MDSFTSIKIDQKTSNYYSLKNGRFNIKLKVSKVICPFGLDEEYKNYVLKFELNESNSGHIKCIEDIKQFEENMKEHFNVKDNEWKSLIHRRENNNIFLECKIKKIRNKLLIDASYEDTQSHYLKTIYELEKNKIMDVVLEIPTLWDFRKQDEENINKIGLLLNVNKIHVY